LQNIRISTGIILLALICTIMMMNTRTVTATIIMATNITTVEMPS
jgi:hypothetical protein